MNEIVVLGSLNVDRVVTVERAPRGGETVVGKSFRIFNGGKGANQAFAAARLGASVALLGRVGDDDSGRDVLVGLAEEGVNLDRVRCMEGTTTGLAVITVEVGGENRIVVVPGANGAYSEDELARDVDAFKGAKLALFQLETPIGTVGKALKIARWSGCITILDPAPAGKLDRELLACVDYLTPNVRELSILSGLALNGRSRVADIEKAARALIDRGVGKVIAKLGSRGALLVGPKGVARVDAVPVKAVDSTAAGDCFNGALAVALGRGDEEVTAVRFACAAAGLSVSRVGAQASMPRLKELGW